MKAPQVQSSSIPNKVQGQTVSPARMNQTAKEDLSAMKITSQQKDQAIKPYTSSKNAAQSYKAQPASNIDQYVQNKLDPNAQLNKGTMQGGRVYNPAVHA